MSSLSTSNIKTDKLVKKSQKLAELLNDTVEFTHDASTAGMLEFMKTYLVQENLDRDAYFNVLSQYRDNWIVNAIYDIIINDVFVDSGYNDFIKVSIEKGKGKFQNEAEKLFRNLNITNILQSIAGDLLHYGSYPLKVITDKQKGVIALIDDVEPQHVISITDGANRPLCYFVDESVHNPRFTNATYVATAHEYNYYDITQLIQFSLDLDFIKLKLPSAISKTISDSIKSNNSNIGDVLKIYYELDLNNKNSVIVKKERREFVSRSEESSYESDLSNSEIDDRLEEEIESLVPNTIKIRTSKSFIWGVLDKLKDVILLNKVATYNSLAQMFSPKLVGIPLPDVYDPAQAIEIVQKYETLLNSDLAKITFNNNLKSFNFSEVAKIKVIPIVGDRSTPTTVDYGASDRIVDNDRVNEEMTETLNSLGIPAELFNGQSDSKTNLKTNIRYAKKIKKIQRNIVRPLKQLLLIHFAYKFPDETITLDDIDIQLKNNTNIDELENMEAQDIVISASNSVISMMSQIVELNNSIKEQGKAVDYDIDYSELIKSLKDQLSMVGSPFASCLKESKNIKKQDLMTTVTDMERSASVGDAVGSSAYLYKSTGRDETTSSDNSSGSVEISTETTSSSSE